MKHGKWIQGIIILILLSIVVQGSTINEFSDDISDFNATSSITKYFDLPRNVDITFTNITIKGLYTPNNISISDDSGTWLHNAKGCHLTGTEITINSESDYVWIRNISVRNTSTATGIAVFLANDTNLSEQATNCTLSGSNPPSCDVNYLVQNGTSLKIVSNRDWCSTPNCYVYNYYAKSRPTTNNDLIWSDNECYITGSGWVNDGYHREIEWISYANSNFSADYPLNVSVFINNTLVFNHPEELNSTNTSVDFSGPLELCTKYQSLCSFYLTASVFGVIEISDLQVDYERQITMNFTEAVNLTTWFINDSINTQEISDIQFHMKDFSEDTTLMTFNDGLQYYELYNNDGGVNGITRNLKIDNTLIYEITVAVNKDGEKVLENARVELFEDLLNNTLYARLTNSIGKAYLKVNPNSTYYVCAYYKDYTPSCRLISDSDFDQTIVLNLLTGSSSGFTIDTVILPNSSVTSDTARINITLVREMFDTREKLGIGLFMVLILSLIFAVIFENRVAGSGIIVFSIVMLLFVRIFPILTLPLFIIALVKGYKVWRKISDGT